MLHQTRLLSCAVISLRTQSSRRREGIGASRAVGRPGLCRVVMSSPGKVKDPCQSFLSRTVFVAVDAVERRLCSERYYLAPLSHMSIVVSDPVDGVS